MNDAPKVLSPEEYAQLLEKLLVEGKGYRLGGEVIVIPEGDKSYYVTHNIQKGLDLLQRGEKPNPLDDDFNRLSETNLFSDFEPADPSNPGNGFMQPQPGNDRIVLPVDERIIIPVAWAETFTIEAGGYLMMAQQHVAELALALEDIRHGKTTAEKALYSPGQSPGSKIAKFNAYGFNKHNLPEYDHLPIELTSATKAVTAHLSALTALPFTRRSGKFVSNHIAPERATFKKRVHSRPAV